MAFKSKPPQGPADTGTQGSKPPSIPATSSGNPSRNVFDRMRDPRVLSEYLQKPTREVPVAEEPEARPPVSQNYSPRAVVTPVPERDAGGAVGSSDPDFEAGMDLLSGSLAQHENPPVLAPLVTSPSKSTVSSAAGVRPPNPEPIHLGDDQHKQVGGEFESGDYSLHRPDLVNLPMPAPKVDIDPVCLTPIDIAPGGYTSQQSLPVSEPATELIVLSKSFLTIKRLVIAGVVAATLLFGTLTAKLFMPQTPEQKARQAQEEKATLERVAGMFPCNIYIDRLFSDVLFYRGIEIIPEQKARDVHVGARVFQKGIIYFRYAKYLTTKDLTDEFDIDVQKDERLTRLKLGTQVVTLPNLPRCYAYFPIDHYASFVSPFFSPARYSPVKEFRDLAGMNPVKPHKHYDQVFFFKDVRPGAGNNSFPYCQMDSEAGCTPEKFAYSSLDTIRVPGTYRGVSVSSFGLRYVKSDLIQFQLGKNYSYVIFE